MKLVRILILAVVMIVAQSIPAAAYDSAAFLRDCTQAVSQYDEPAKKAEASDVLAAERCRSFALGGFSVLNSLTINKVEARLICAPASVKQEQVVRVVSKWLKANPEKLHMKAEYAVVMSLREAFPCQKKGKESKSPLF